MTSPESEPVEESREIVPVQPGRDTLHGSIWGVLAAGGIYLALSLVSWNQIEEDAYIYLRNAANLAEGYGYVFNRGGARIETSSSFLWLQLLTALHWLGAPMVLASKLLGIAFGLLSLVLTWLLGKRVLEQPVSAAMPPLLLAVSVPFVMWGQRGLETPLYISLLLWCALWVIDVRWQRLAWIPAAFLLVGRPESPVLSFAMLLFIVPRHGERAGAMKQLALLFAIAGVLEVTRFIYFRDLVSQPFYLKMNKGTFSAWQFLYHDLRHSNLLWLALPIVAVGWRRSFWTRERVLLAVTTALLLGWAARGGGHTPYSRHFAPAAPFFYILIVAAIETLCASLARYRRAGSLVAHALVWCLIALNPTVPSKRFQSVPNPLHDLVGRFAREPALHAEALVAEMRDPATRTVLDRTPNPIEQNWQALIGKLISTHYEPDVVVVSDQMGQTPYYAGPETTFIDSFGLTHRATGFYRFDQRARGSASLRAYDSVVSALVGWVYPDEQRHPSMEQVLDGIFGAEPDLILINRYAASRPGRTPTRALRADPRLRRDFEPRFLLAGMSELYERRGREMATLTFPKGLASRPLGVDAQRKPREAVDRH
jgi:hypothetical protein